MSPARPLGPARLVLTFVLLSAVGEKSSSDAGYDWLKQGEKVYSDGRFSVYAYDGPLL